MEISIPPTHAIIEIHYACWRCVNSHFLTSGTGYTIVLGTKVMERPLSPPDSQSEGRYFGTRNKEIPFVPSGAPGVLARLGGLYCLSYHAHHM